MTNRSHSTVKQSRTCWIRGRDPLGVVQVEGNAVGRNTTATDNTTVWQPEEEFVYLGSVLTATGLFTAPSTSLV